MKKVTPIILLFLSFISAYSQIDYKSEAKKDLTEKKRKFDEKKTLYKKEKDSLKMLTDALSQIPQERLKKAKMLRKTLESLHEEAKTAVAFYEQKQVPKEDLDSYFKIPDEEYEALIKNTQKVKDTEEYEDKVYLLFGTNQLIVKEDIIKDPTANSIFKNILETDSEIHLGDFWIPKDNAQIPITKITEKENTVKRRNSEKTKTVKVNDTTIRYLGFDKIELELFEGSLVDIKVYLKGEDGDVYLFENKLSISLIYYTTTSERFYLKNKARKTFQDNNKDFTGFKLRLSDVLRYFSKPGRNYIPDDQNFTFPLDLQKDKTNEKYANVYELYQSTSLENVLDLRAYTDFLSLFGDTPNGIAQFEGQAIFFINPYRIIHTSLFPFKKIKPYISYARLDDEDRSLTLELESINGTERTINGLDQLQKSFLDAGVKLDILNFNIGKEYPFEVNIFGALRYQISRIELDSTTVENYNTLGLGSGINIDFERFDNFSFSYSSEFTNYSQDSFNDISGIIDPNDFWVFRNEAEVSYFPGTSKKNSIFLRFRVFNDLSDDIDSNFFQFQFGYKFSLGLQKVRSRN